MEKTLYRTYKLNSKETLNLDGKEPLRTYGMVMQFDEKLKIHFEADISFLGYDHEGQIICLYNRHQVYINNREPCLIADQLADRIGKVLYPALLLASGSGKLLSIFNQEEIQQRWQKEKKGILQYYTGDIVNKVIDRMELILNDRKKLDDTLRQDWLMSVFLPGLFTPTGTGVLPDVSFYCPITAYAPPVHYKADRDSVEQTADNFIITFKGQIEESRSAEDILYGRYFPLQEALYGNGTKAYGRLELRYNLYQKDYSIRSVTGKITFQSQTENENISLSLYHLPHKKALLHDNVKLVDKKKRFIHE